MNNTAPVKEIKNYFFHLLRTLVVGIMSLTVLQKIHTVTLAQILCDIIFCILYTRYV